MAMSNVFDSVCESQMVQSVVKYVTPEEQEFRKQYSFEQRYEEAHRVLHKYPDRIPVICERDRDSNLPSDSKKKFLIPRDMTIGQFVYVVRKRVRLPPEKAIFLFITQEKKDGMMTKILAPTSQIFDRLYFECKDRDAFLYVSVSGEHVFGNQMYFPYNVLR